MWPYNSGFSFSPPCLSSAHTTHNTHTLYTTHTIRTTHTTHTTNTIHTPFTLPRQLRPLIPRRNSSNSRSSRNSRNSYYSHYSHYSLYSAMSKKSSMSPTHSDKKSNKAKSVQFSHKETISYSSEDSAAACKFAQRSREYFDILRHVVRKVKAWVEACAEKVSYDDSYSDYSISDVEREYHTIHVVFRQQSHLADSGCNPRILTHKKMEYEVKPDLSREAFEQALTKYAEKIGIQDQHATRRLHGFFLAEIMGRQSVLTDRKWELVKEYGETGRLGATMVFELYPLSEEEIAVAEELEEIERAERKAERAERRAEREKAERKAQRAERAGRTAEWAAREGRDAMRR